MSRTLTEKFEFSSEEKSVRLPPQKYSINPKSPIASITSGNQQFTAIADTHHGKAAVIYRLAAEIPDIAKTGVKHLILEIPIFPEGHPLVKNSFINNGHRAIEDILKRLNSKPPQITEREIWSKAGLFSDDHDESKTNEVGKANAQLLIDCMNNGIRVHFSGDDKGILELDKVNRLADKWDAYIEKNQRLANILENLESDPSHIKKMKIPEREKKLLNFRLNSFENTLKGYSAEYELALAEYNEARMGTKTEAERAKRFIDITSGEKAIVVFGRNHFNNSFDLNEIIGSSLLWEALKKDTKAQAEVPVIEIYVNKNGREQSIEWDKSSKAPIIDPTIRIYADTGKVEIPDSMREIASFQTASQQHKIHQPNAILEKQL